MAKTHSSRSTSRSASTTTASSTPRAATRTGAKGAATTGDGSATRAAATKANTTTKAAPAKAAAAKAGASNGPAKPRTRRRTVRTTGTGNGTTELPHEQIAGRAYEIWISTGCIPGRDEQNWSEAEAQLRAEQGH